MKKRLVLFMLSVCIVLLAGCQRITVEDAEKIAGKEEGKIARNLTRFHQQMAEVESDKNTTSDAAVQGPEKSLDDETNKKIIVVDRGEPVNITDMECQVTDVLVTQNIFELASMADAETVESVTGELIKMYGPDSKVAKINGKVYLQENGDMGETFKQFIFVKLRVHSMRKGNYEVCMWPSVYSDNGGLKFQYEDGIEVETIDKRQQEGADSLYYTFEAGQDEEFIMAFSVRKDIAGKSLYINTRFLSSNQYSSSPMQIEDGTTFIKIIQGD